MASRVTFDTPIQSNDQSFDRVLRAGLPVAALFWSRTIPPELEAELNARAQADAGRLLVVKIKTEDNPGLIRNFAIHATPTLITFRNGQEVGRAENVNATQFREHVNYLLDRGPQPRVAPPPRAAEDGHGPSPTGERVRASADGATGSPLTVTDANFQSEVLQSGVPVVVDLWAPWCGPCRMVAPILEKFAREYAGRLRVAKLNVDENPRTAQMYQVTGIPTLLFFRNGQMVNRVVGALPERQLRGTVDRFLS